MVLKFEMRTLVVLLGLLACAAMAGRVQAQTAGVIQFVAGEVKLVPSAGSVRAARKGVLLQVGDTLATAPGALVQVKMGDGAIVVVQPESRLTVAEFHYEGREDGNEKVRYRLEQGGFRAVTGAIGRTHKKNYLIETPIAHMGVRGTDHESYYFPATGPGGPDDAKSGAYNKVNTGRTFIRTEAGEVEIDPNQVGYVASAGDVPAILPQVPGFFNRSIAPRNARRPADATPEATDMADVADQKVVQSTNGVRLLRTRGPRVEPGTGNGPLAGFITAQGGGRFGSSGNGVTIVDNGAASTSGSLVVGSGSVDWTTWEGGVAVVGGIGTAGSTHVIDTSDRTDLAALPPSLMNATYTWTNGVGPNAPTNQAGVVGTINSLSVGVNFSSQQLTSYDLSASAGSVNWNVNLDMNKPHTIGDFTGVGGVRLSGAMGQAGVAHGTFVGSQAENLITTFGLSGSGNNALSGSAYLSRP